MLRKIATERVAQPLSMKSSLPELTTEKRHSLPGHMDNPEEEKTGKGQYADAFQRTVYGGRTTFVQDIPIFSITAPTWKLGTFFQRHVRVV